jgi:hypothetical protein
MCIFSRSYESRIKEIRLYCHDPETDFNDISRSYIVAIID